MIEDPPDPNYIYINTNTQIAEIYCVNNAKCGRDWGYNGETNYKEAYVKTPIDWSDLITEAKKVNDDFLHEGRKSIVLETDIGTVIVDKHYGVVVSVIRESEEFSYKNLMYNSIKDEDVNPPKHLLKE